MSTDTPPDAKAEMRRAAFVARKAAHAEAGEAALLARDHFLAARLHTGAAVISGYCPMRTEIDPLPLMTALHAAGHALCVPVIEGKGRPLAFRAWTPECELVDGPFGAQVPAGGEWLEPELLIAPLVAFDRVGWRLGYGGGFYDRTLARLRAARRTLAVGVAYAAQEMPDIPRDATDQPLDAVVTEKGLLRPGPGA